MQIIYNYRASNILWTVIWMSNQNSATIADLHFIVESQAVDVRRTDLQHIVLLISQCWNKHPNVYE